MHRVRVPAGARVCILCVCGREGGYASCACVGAVEAMHVVRVRPRASV